LVASSSLMSQSNEPLPKANERSKQALESRLPRRALLRGGLASFAAAMMSRGLPGCGPTVDGTDAAPGQPDTGPGTMDAGPTIFPVRNIPDPPALRSRIGELGELGEPDENGVRL